MMNRVLVKHMIKHLVATEWHDKHESNTTLLSNITNRWEAIYINQEWLIHANHWHVNSYVQAMQFLVRQDERW